MILPNCARIGEAPERLDIELEGARARGRRLVEHARGDLDVLRLEGADDLAGRQVARRDLVGIEPDAHRIVARAEDRARRRRRRARASTSFTWSVA